MYYLGFLASKVSDEKTVQAECSLVAVGSVELGAIVVGRAD